jgi:hypothetical protein
MTEYIWTKKGQDYWDNIKGPSNVSELRTDGDDATFAGKPVGLFGTVSKGWRIKGFIIKKEEI